MANAINWFEIPASNFDRAVKFYSAIFDSEFPQQDMMGMKMAFFPTENNGVGGALVQGEGHVPSTEGSTVYLNGGSDLSAPLSRVESAGGSVIMPKTKISDEIGFMAFIRDSEGNRVALHSPN